MRVLVTGANGFLGSHLTRALLAAGYRVTGLVRSSSSLLRLSDVAQSEALTLIRIDQVSIDTVFGASPFHAVMHTATEYGRGQLRAAMVPGLVEANMAFPMEILLSAIAHDVPLFVNTDSYFNKPGTTYNSLQGYSLTKKYFLDWLLHHSGQIHVVNMRLEHIYGPSDGDDKFIPTLVDQIARRAVPRFGMTPGGQARDFIHVDDVCAAYLTLLAHPERFAQPGYDYFEIGTGSTMTIRELATLIKELSGSHTQLDFGALPYRADEITTSSADPAFRTEFGFSPAVGIESGIRDLVEAH